MDHTMWFLISAICLLVGYLVGYTNGRVDALDRIHQMCITHLAKVKEIVGR